MATKEILADGAVTVTYPTDLSEDPAVESLVIDECGRLIVNDIVGAFQKGAWKFGVELSVEKTKPGWFDTTVSLRLSWRGTRSAVEAYTIAAKRYLARIA